MNKIRTALVAGVFAATASLGFSSANAAGDAVHPPEHHWSFSGLFGTYDRAALRRGFEVYKGVCAGCHGLRLVAYRNLMDIGFTEDEVKAIAAEVDVPAEPNEDGEIEAAPVSRRTSSSRHLRMKTPRGRAITGHSRRICR